MKDKSKGNKFSNYRKFLTEIVVDEIYNPLAENHLGAGSLHHKE